MRSVSTLIVIALSAASTAALAAPAAGAQAVHAPSGGTVAGIAPPPAPATPAAPVSRERRFLSGGVAVVVLPDGRVFADFGRGYEQVVRNCAAPSTYVAPPVAAAGPQPAVLQPAVVQPAAGVSQPVPYSPPAPVQPTAVQTRMSDLSCWASDSRGQILIAHP